MAYMNQTMKKKIAENLKPILKKYGVKGSLRVRNHMAICLTLRSGKIDFIGDLVDEQNSALGPVKVVKDELRKKYHLGVNPYWCHEHYTGKSKKFLAEAIKALKSADWYDRSEIQIDHFDTAYYYDIDIGEWNKPYTLEK